jgi:hypothetical protein
MIYAKEKARRALLDEFRDQVIKKVGSSENLVSNVVEPYADAYLVAKNCQYQSTSNAADVNALLKWLNRIDNVDWLPSAIRFLADKGSDVAYVLWFFRKLERLAACMHICGYDVNARIERYAGVLSDLENRHSLSSPIKALDLTNDEKKAMLEALGGHVYDLSARRRNYLILRLDSFLTDGAATYDPSVLTIEHVLPQTVDPKSQWAVWWPDGHTREQWVHRLANLVPLTQRRNSQAQNYDFEKKKKVYFGGKEGVASYALTTQVLKTPSWKPDVVMDRQKDLLALLWKRWELAPA